MISNFFIKLFPIKLFWVNYVQKASASGRIPTTYLRRDSTLSNHEILVSRMIDRSIRPLFPSGFNADTQVSCNLLTFGGQQNPDVVCINTVSYALHTSDIPWNGPIGCVRVGMAGSKFIVNPTKKLLEKSPLNLVITVSPNGNILMVEGWANNLKQSQFINAFEYGTYEARKVVEAIKNSKYSNIPKRKVITEEKDETLYETIKTLTELQLYYVYTNADHDKITRDDAVNDIRQRTLDLLKKDEKYSQNFRTENEQKFYEYFTDVAKKVFRKVIIDEEKRCDGRKLDQLRPISCKVNLLDGLHGSALFQRGQTQVLCSLTFDSPDSMYKTDAITNMVSPSLTKLDKKFMLHYEFPQYAVNEIGRSGGRPDRREIGHGALAEKALYPIVPSDTNYTIRLLCEVLESNGSSSMASVCAGSLALIDAGVEIPELACGVAMGLVSNYDNNNNIKNYKILTDLAGIEDFMGDTDFKVAGTQNGITAVQVDVKNNGLPLKICREVIEKSQAARAEILELMKKAVEQREKNPKRLPVVKEIKIQIHERSKFLGIGGMNLRKIENSTGVTVTPIDEVTFNIFAPNVEAYNEAEEMIKNILGTIKEPELQFGAVYTAKVVSIVESGVMVQLHPAMKPVLLPNSQLDATKIRHGSMSGFKEGQEIQVKYFGRDPATGAVRLSRKALFLSAYRHKNLLNETNKSEINIKNILGQSEKNENVQN